MNTVEAQRRPEAGVVGPRHFDGIVTQVRWAGAGENGHRYDLILRPWFWLAGRRRSLLLGALGRGPGEDEGVEEDRDDRARKDQVAALRRQYAEPCAERGEDEGKFADLREAGRNGQRRTQGIAERHHQHGSGQRLAQDDDGHHRPGKMAILAIPSPRNGQNLGAIFQKCLGAANGDRRAGKLRIAQAHGVGHGFGTKIEIVCALGQRGVVCHEADQFGKCFCHNIELF